MNKLVLVFGTLFVLFAFLSEKAEGGKFLDNLCEKCGYCAKDKTCEGCANCTLCKDRKVSQPSVSRSLTIIVDLFLRAPAGSARKTRPRLSAGHAVLKAVTSAEELTEKVWSPASNGQLRRNNKKKRKTYKYRKRVSYSTNEFGLTSYS